MTPQEERNRRFDENFKVFFDNVGRPTVTSYSGWGSDDIKSFIDSEIALAVAEETKRWIDQPANAHDEAIRKAERERISEKIELLKCSYRFSPPYTKEDMLVEGQAERIHNNAIEYVLSLITKDK